MVREITEITGAESNKRRKMWAEPPNFVQHVVAFLDVHTATKLLRLNKAWGAPFHSECNYLWRVMNVSLCRSRALYLTPDGSDALSRKEAFLYSFRRRDMWGHEKPATAPPAGGNPAADKSDVDKAGENFNVHVCARLRPADERRIAAQLSSAEASGSQVVIPLHQRIRGIKRTHGITDTNEAGRILMKQSADGASYATAHKAQVLDADESLRSVMTLAPGVGMRAFEFDAVFKGEATQTSVYAASGGKVVRDFINGTDSCCIVFGQTGSGKTYTMFGEGVAGEQAGIVPQACTEVLEAMRERQENHGVASQLSLSYVEVFGDEVNDLLNEGHPVGQNRSAAQRWVLEGRAQHPVDSMEHMSELIREGDRQKRRAATFMNERSSRAHTLFILSLKQRHSETGVEVESMMILADLGGSEDTKKSGAAAAVTAAGRKKAAPAIDSDIDEDTPVEEGDSDVEQKANWNEYYRNRMRMQEAIHINMGLLALKECVRALHARQKGDRVHVPYQNSKLTHLLSCVLGGEASTSVVVTGSPFPVDAIETINTLRFGEQCRAIVTSQAKLDATARAVRDMVQQLDKEIAVAEAAYRSSEQWVAERVKKTRQERAADDVDEDEEEDEEAAKEAAIKAAEGAERQDVFGVQRDIKQEEMVTVYKMKGGEAESKHLEELLARKRRLQGVV